MDNRGFEELEHTADLAYRLHAADMESLLHTATRALHHAQELVFDRPAGRSRSLSLTSFDRETLLVQWLEEELFTLATDGLAWCSWDISMTGDASLRARVTPTPAASYQVEIKAVTFHHLHISEREQGLETVIVFDV